MQGGRSHSQETNLQESCKILDLEQQICKRFLGQFSFSGITATLMRAGVPSVMWQSRAGDERGARAWEVDESVFKRRIGINPLSDV